MYVFAAICGILARTVPVIYSSTNIHCLLCVGHFLLASHYPGSGFTFNNITDRHNVFWYALGTRYFVDVNGNVCIRDACTRCAWLCAVWLYVSVCVLVGMCGEQ